MIRLLLQAIEELQNAIDDLLEEVATNEKPLAPLGAFQQNAFFNLGRCYAVIVDDGLAVASELAKERNLNVDLLHAKILRKPEPEIVLPVLKQRNNANITDELEVTSSLSLRRLKTSIGT